MSDQCGQIALGSIYPQIANLDAKDPRAGAPAPANASYTASAPPGPELPFGASALPFPPTDAPPPYSRFAPSYPGAAVGWAGDPVHGPSVSRATPLDEQIVMAGAHGDFDAVRALLRDRFQPIDARDELDQTLLIQAIRTKSLAFVNILINAGAGYTADALAEAEKTNLTSMVRAIKEIRPFYAPLLDFFSRLIGRALSAVSEPNTKGEVVMSRASRVWVEQPDIGRRPVTWRDVEWAIDSRGPSVVRSKPALLTAALSRLDEQAVCLIKPNDWTSGLAFLRALSEPQRRAYLSVIPALVSHLMKADPSASTGDVRRLMRWLRPAERMAATDALILSDPDGLNQLLRADRSLANLRNVGAPSPIARTFARLRSLNAAKEQEHDVLRALGQNAPRVTDAFGFVATADDLGKQAQWLAAEKTRLSTRIEQYTSEIARLERSLSVLCRFYAEPTRREFIDAIRNNRFDEVRRYIKQDPALSATGVEDERTGGLITVGYYARARGYTRLADMLIDHHTRYKGEQERFKHQVEVAQASIQGMALGAALNRALSQPRASMQRRG